MSHGIKYAKTAFGQIVIGPPGSGKTTYCHGMQQFLEALKRPACIVNLDPANENIPYSCDVDISELISLEDVMSNLELGPNGGLLYCMEYLEANLDWLIEKLRGFSGKYFVFDCPGQVELYTHHSSLRNIIEKLTSKEHDFRLTAMHLVDSHYCSEASKFVSVLLTSLATMLQINLPHVNVLSKMDVAEQYGKFAFHLEYYTEVLDLEKLLLSEGDDPFWKRYKKLNEKLCSVIEDYSLVSFVPLNVQDKESMLNVVKQADKANGYCYGAVEERNVQKMLSAAIGAEYEFDRSAAVHEKYLGEDK